MLVEISLVQMKSNKKDRVIDPGDLLHNLTNGLFLAKNRVSLAKHLRVAFTFSLKLQIDYIRDEQLWLFFALN